MIFMWCFRLRINAFCRFYTSAVHRLFKTGILKLRWSLHTWTSDILVHLGDWWYPAFTLPKDLIGAQNKSRCKVTPSNKCLFILWFLMLFIWFIMFYFIVFWYVAITDGYNGMAHFCHPYIYNWSNLNTNDNVELLPTNMIWSHTAWLR